MKNVYTANYQNLPLRFVQKDDDLYISKADLRAILCSCFPDLYAGFIDNLLNDILKNIIGDALDHKVAAIADKRIGAVIHFHAVGNMLHIFTTLTSHENEILRDGSCKVGSFYNWYIEILNEASAFFGKGLVDMFVSVKNRLDRIAPPFRVDISEEGGIWTAICDDLGLVTEADSYESVVESVWDIAPDLYELNGFDSDQEQIRLDFIQHQVHQLKACKGM
jgi:hypothetical protein